MADFFEEFGRMVSDVASDITKKTGRYPGDPED